MHSEGILAGELKHGPLALVDNLMPVIMIIMRDNTYTKCQNALQQVVARQVRAISFSSSDQMIHLPSSQNLQNVAAPSEDAFTVQTNPKKTHVYQTRQTRLGGKMPSTVKYWIRSNTVCRLVCISKTSEHYTSDDPSPQ